MASETAERFMQALQEAEQTNDLEPLVALFHDQAELRRIANDDTLRGRDGARQFWKEYLSAFSRIRSRFTNVVEEGGTAVLEWVSEAEPGTDRPFTYEGVSILELEYDQVRRFRTYYDTARFLPTQSREQD